MPIIKTETVKTHVEGMKDTQPEIYNKLMERYGTEEALIQEVHSLTERMVNSKEMKEARI